MPRFQDCGFPLLFVIIWMRSELKSVSMVRKERALETDPDSHTQRETRKETEGGMPTGRQERENRKWQWGQGAKGPHLRLMASGSFYEMR